MGEYDLVNIDATLDSIKFIDAMHQIRHMKPAIALMEAIMGKLHLVIPLHVDVEDEASIYWLIVGNDTFANFISTTFEIKSAGTFGSIQMHTAPRKPSKIRKVCMDKIQDLMKQGRPDEFNHSYYKLCSTINYSSTVEDPYGSMCQAHKFYSELNIK